MKKLFVLLIPILLLVSCGSITYLRPYDSDIDPAHTCILEIDDYLSVTSFDNTRVYWSPILFAQKAEVKIPAGRHVLKVNYKRDTGYQIEQASGIVIDYNFLAGAIYTLTFKTYGSIIELVITRK